MISIPFVHAEAQQQQQQRQRPRPQAIQQQPQVIGFTPKKTGPATRTLLIEPSAPINNLFARAEEGIARSDWKFAIDSLQRIIDDPEGSLVPREEAPDGLGMGILFESARTRAMRRLANLPLEGLEAYRLLFDGKAKSLFERAKRNHDPAPLRTVVDRYLLSGYGDDAADLLASWSLDEGRVTEAVRVLTDLRGLVPDRDVPETLTLSKLVAANVLLGRSGEAGLYLDELAKHSSDSALLKEWVTLSNGTGKDSEPASGQSAGDWPVAGGVLSRTGRMPAVMPTLAENLPWAFPLPGAEEESALEVSQQRGDSLVLPAPYLVSSDDRIYARVPGGCVCLDAEDMAPNWVSVLPEVALARRYTRRQQLRANPQRPPNMTMDRWPFDSVTAAISVAGGLVLTIEREGLGTFVPEGGGEKAAPARQGAPPANPSVVGATRIVAYDAETGKIRWQRGRTGSPEDPLGMVEFRDVPIQVGSELWVPYRDHSDLYLATLDPATGALRRSLLLGSMSPARIGEDYTLQIAYADGILFVPTGFGVLFAVDASDGTVRWAQQYAQEAFDGRLPSGQIIEHWPTCSVTVSGGLVLLASVEQEGIVAFDAVDGSWRWTSAPPKSAYVLAADGERLWTGGRSVSCLSLSTGKVLWEKPVVQAPSGRAVLSGSVIHVPTVAGLLSLDGASGEMRGMTAPRSGTSEVASLLCTGGAMYSLDSATIRKFPDLELTYPTLLAKHKDDPRNAAVAISLGWLEFLRGKPEQARHVLESIPASVLVDDPVRTLEVAHLHVEALLAQSEASSTKPLEALALLERARAVAQSGSQRLRCSTAIADQLLSLGRNADAYEMLLTTGLGVEGNTLISRDAELFISGRLELARRMGEISSNLSVNERAGFDQRLKQVLTDAKSKLEESPQAAGVRSELRAVADLSASTALGQRALMMLSEWEIATQRYERAEQLLQECVRSEGDRGLKQSAWLRLCKLYGDKSLANPSAFFGCLNALDEQYGDDPLPKEEEATTDSISSTIRENTAKLRKASNLLKQVPGSRLRPPRISAQPIWEIKSEPAGTPIPRIVTFADRATATADQKLILAGGDDHLTSRSLKKGEVIWKAGLSLPTNWRQPGRGPEQTTDAQRLATSDGQTGVFVAEDGVFSVGLATGRRLWTLPLSPSVTIGRGESRDWMVAAQNGAVAVLPRADRVSLLRLLDGSILWQRDLRGESLARVWLTDDRVAAWGADGQRLFLFDRADGRLIGQVFFRQPDPKRARLPIVPTRGVIIGPMCADEGDGIAAVSMTNGQLLWRMPLEKPLAGLFEPSEGLVGVGMLGGDVRIVNAQSGEVLLDRNVPGTQSIIGGLLTDGTFLVQQVWADRGQQLPGLAAMDVATGEKLWDRRDIALMERGLKSMGLYGGGVPAILESRQSGGRRLVLTMIDTRTGLDACPPVELRFGNAPPMLNGDFALWPDTIMVGTQEMIQAFAVESIMGNQGGEGP